MKKINKNNPFKTPEGYFEKFDGKLLDKLSHKESTIPENDGFGIPEGYLDNLNKNIRQKLEASEIKVISISSYKKYYYATASIAAITLVVLWLNFMSSEEIGFEDLAHTEIETYFEDIELGLSTYEIAEMLPVDELEISDILKTQFNEEDMLDYLNNNLDDFEELNLEGNE